MKKDKRIQAQLGKEQFDKVKKIADEMFEGNMSLAIRYIINKFKAQ